MFTVNSSINKATTAHTQLHKTPRKPLHTFESFIQLIFAKDDAQVMNGTCVKLHTEDDVTRRAAETLVVTLEL